MPAINYIWDPVSDNILEESMDGETTVYTSEPELFGSIVSQTRTSNATQESRIIHSDEMGSTRELTSSSEIVTNTYVDDSWGESIATTGTGRNPFRWLGSSGYYLDLEIGSYYVRRRHYDPLSGSWLNSEPAMILGHRYLSKVVSGYLPVSAKRRYRTGLGRLGADAFRTILPSAQSQMKKPAKSTPPCTSAPTVVEVKNGVGVCTKQTDHPEKWNATGAWIIGDHGGAGVGPVRIAIAAKALCMYERKIHSCYKCSPCCFTIAPADRYARHTTIDQFGVRTVDIPETQALFVNHVELSVSDLLEPLGIAGGAAAVALQQSGYDVDLLSVYQPDADTLRRIVDGYCFGKTPDHFGPSPKGIYECKAK